MQRAPDLKLQSCRACTDTFKAHDEAPPPPPPPGPLLPLKSPKTPSLRQAQRLRRLGNVDAAEVGVFSSKSVAGCVGRPWDGQSDVLESAAT